MILVAFSRDLKQRLEKSQKDARIYISTDRPGQYFATRSFQGQALPEENSKAGDLALAQRKMRDFRNDLERTDARKGNNPSLRCWMITPRRFKARNRR